MNKPVRLQRKRTRGFKLVSPNGLPIVYVGRPTEWGNIFKLVDGRTPEQSVAMYKAWLSHNRSINLEYLRGKNLACWCPIGQACHADVLLELANT